MAKLFMQFLLMTGLFFGAWAALSRVDYVKIFDLTQVDDKAERKIGDLVMKEVKRKNPEVTNEDAEKILDKIKHRLCAANAIDEDDIHIHLVKSSDVNAFALPGNHLVIYSGLLKRCDSVSELCGVMSHEIGHMQLHHVAKRMSVAVVTAVLSGSAEAVGQILKMLSSSAFERAQEADADKYGVECLLKARIDPRGFSNFMMKVAKMQENMPDAFEWISSHPDSKKRAETIRATSAGESHFEPVLTDEEWTTLQGASSED